MLKLTRQPDETSNQNHDTPPKNLSYHTLRVGTLLRASALDINQGLMPRKTQLEELGESLALVPVAERRYVDFEDLSVVLLGLIAKDGGVRTGF